jgi:hypothetical protein
MITAVCKFLPAYALARAMTLIEHSSDTQKHPPLDGKPEPAQMAAAENTVEQLELSGYEVRERKEKARRHGTL